ncbi:Ribonuclease G/E [Rubricella aquisinus]|uniref:Ribonuclease G/E n=1 Tax=Rubricella aquisinus TaxID=2028108 RepID=A0A840WPK9_9RHOB|nr:ribonuclease E/G [Rubricella aquisinus]MBB5516591.1 Ribonuclease G/E [Rubricella aquisinus]
MKGRVIAIDQRPDGQGSMAALIEDGIVEDLIIDPAAPGIHPGQIWRGQPDRPMKGMGGLMVRLDAGNGFLKEGKGVAPGEPLLVQVSTHAEPGKAPPVTRRLLFKSRYAIATPMAPGLNISRSIRDPEERDVLEAAVAPLMQPGEGMIIRTAARGVVLEDVAEDAAAMLELSRAVMADLTGPPELLVDTPDAGMLAWRDWPEPDILDDAPGAFERHNVWDTIDGLRSPRVPLGQGAYMFIEPVRALVAVDVNTGKDMSPAGSLTTNIAALRALPRQLRLRGLGGQIVLDLAPMTKRDRPQLESTLKSAFRGDVETSLAGWTPLGHMELLRKRERLPLAEVLPA